MTAEVSGAGVSRVAAGVTTHVAPGAGQWTPGGGASGAVRNTEKPTAELISRSRPRRRDHWLRARHTSLRAHARGDHTQSTGSALPVLSTPRCAAGGGAAATSSAHPSLASVRTLSDSLHQHSPSDSLRASHHIDLSSHAVSPQRSSSEYPHRCPPSAHPPHPHALLPRAACLNPGGGGESPLGRRLGRRPVDAALKLRPTLRPARAAAWPPRPGRGACGRGEARATSAAGARGCCRARGASPSA